jgi:hypothetical protein
MTSCQAIPSHLMTADSLLIIGRRLAPDCTMITATVASWARSRAGLGPCQSGAVGSETTPEANTAA